MSRRPDGALELPHVASPANDRPRLSMRDVWKERNFWSIAMTFALAFCAMSATLTHIVPRITDLGHSLSLASMVMAICAGAGIFGKLSFGWLADRLRVRRIMLLILAIQFTGQLIMYLNENLLWFGLGAALFGYGVGGVVPLHGTIVGKTFGRERFGAVLGLMRPAMFPVQILGVPFAGWVFDMTGSYNLAFQVLLCLYGIAALVIGTYRAPEPVRTE